MKVAVTGSHGFIGRHVVGLLLDRGDEVVGLDALTYAGDPGANIDRSGFTLVRANVATGPIDIGTIDHVDRIVHLAAESHVDNSIEGGAASFVRTNVVGTVRVLELARRLGCRLVHVSTDEVTGDREGLPTADEDSAIVASSPYSASKAAAELLVQAYRRTYNADVVIVRPANCYGPFQHPEKLVPRAITYALSGRPIPVYGDGQQIRQWLYVTDCARGIVAAMERGESGCTYCLAPTDVRRNIDVVKAIASATGTDIVQVADRPGHDRRYDQDAGRARRELGWQPEVPFEQGLVQTIDWYRANGSWWRAAIKRGGRWA